VQVQHDKAEATRVQQMRKKRSYSTRWSRRKQRSGFDNSWSANSMTSRASFQGSTTSSARRGAAEATDSDAATLLARRAGGKAVKRRRRSERIWTGTSADASESVLPVADSARFCRRVRMQSNKPRASKLEANGVEAERERRPCEWLRKYADSARTGAVKSRRVSSYVGRGCSTHEQENPEVRGEVSIANQSGSVVSSQESTTPNNSYLSSIVRARPQHLKKAREPSHRALLVANPVHRGNSLSACSPS
jgi:hypothetical protein